VHEALIRNQLGDSLIGHLSRDATAIAARETPVKAAPVATLPLTPVSVPAPAPRKRGRPRKGEVRPAPPKTRLERQSAGMSLPAMLADLPTACDVGTKRNGQGFQSSWIGYKLHLDVADGEKLNDDPAGVQHFQPCGRKVDFLARLTAAKTRMNKKTSSARSMLPTGRSISLCTSFTG